MGREGEKEGKGRGRRRREGEKDKEEKEGKGEREERAKKEEGTSTPKDRMYLELCRHRAHQAPGGKANPPAYAIIQRSARKPKKNAWALFGKRRKIKSPRQPGRVAARSLEEARVAKHASSHMQHRPAGEFGKIKCYAKGGENGLGRGREQWDCARLGMVLMMPPLLLVVLWVWWARMRVWEKWQEAKWW